MNEGLQIYKFNDLTIYQQDFYNMTRLNFMYDRRRLFSFNKNEIKYNSYFPFDMVKGKVKFYGLYLSAYNTIDSFSHMDFDFDIGFNNIEYKIDEKIVYILKKEFNKIDLILEIFNSSQNKSIIDKINNEYNILFSIKGVYNIYIIEMKEVKNINLIKKHISGFLVNRINPQFPYKPCSFDIIDLKCIKELTEKYELLLFRTPIYANYNIIIYSNSEKLVDNFKDKILKLNNNEFNIENLNNLLDSRNFLLV